MALGAEQIPIRQFSFLKIARCGCVSVNSAIQEAEAGGSQVKASLGNLKETFN